MTDLELAETIRDLGYWLHDHGWRHHDLPLPGVSAYRHPSGMEMVWSTPTGSSLSVVNAVLKEAYS